MHVKMFLCGLLFTCLISYRLPAQTDFLVLAKGDTLHGEVVLLNFGNRQAIQLTDAQRKKSTYEKIQVKAVKIDGHYYHTIRTLNGYSLMKLLKAGYLSLYAFQFENQNTWDGRYLYKRDGSGMEVSSLMFRKRISHFLADCSEMADKIKSRELNRYHLDEMIDQYNACLDQRTLAAEIQSAKASKIDELENAVNALQESEQKTTALEVIAELRIKVGRGEKVPSMFSKALLDALTAYPQLTELAQAALSEMQR